MPFFAFTVSVLFSFSTRTLGCGCSTCVQIALVFTVGAVELFEQAIIRCDFPDLGGQRVDQIAVMGHQQDRPLIFRQDCLQDLL